MCLDFYHTVTVSLRRTSYVFVFLRTDCFMKRRKKIQCQHKKESKDGVCANEQEKCFKIHYLCENKFSGCGFMKRIHPLTNISTRWCQTRYTHTKPHIFRVLFFKCRHRCRLYTCEICTFRMFFFCEVSFFYQNQHANGRNVRTYQDIHYFGSENGRHWSGKRWVFWCFPMNFAADAAVQHSCSETTSFGKRNAGKNVW